MRPGVRMGVDVGRARIGVARRAPAGVIAGPARTRRRGGGAGAPRTGLADEFAAFEVVVGLPLSLSGADTASTADAREFAGRLAAASGRPVRLVDERLSTVSAQRSLHGAGKDVRGSRAVIDQVAATIILQNALDAERSSGRPPGELMTQDEG